MFEKEAEEYATENWEYYEEGKNDSKELKQAYQQGAEFGYNKGNEQLTKAKEIIKDYLTIVKGSHTTVCGVPEESRTIHVLKLNKEAEQFLKESD